MSKKFKKFVVMLLVLFVLCLSGTVFAQAPIGSSPIYVGDLVVISPNRSHGGIFTEFGYSQQVVNMAGMVYRYKLD